MSGCVCRNKQDLAVAGHGLIERRPTEPFPADEQAGSTVCG